MIFRAKREKQVLKNLFSKFFSNFQIFFFGPIVHLKGHPHTKFGKISKQNSKTTAVQSLDFEIQKIVIIWPDNFDGAFRTEILHIRRFYLTRVDPPGG